MKSNRERGQGSSWTVAPAEEEGKILFIIICCYNQMLPLIPLKNNLCDSSTGSVHVYSSYKCKSLQLTHNGTSQRPWPVITIGVQRLLRL
jgi:hypothetical protein